MWHAEEVDFNQLAQLLNNVEVRGGTVFQIVDGSATRSGKIGVVWHDHDSPEGKTGTRPSRSDRRNA